VLDNIFNGKPLKKIKKCTLTLSPEKWPKADSWIHENWLELENIYSA
jgi:hypothetical protein